MSTHKKPKKLRVAPSSPTAQIDALSESLGYAAALPRKQQGVLRSRGGSMPVDVIELLANLAEQHDGVIAGVAFDAAAARDALARSKSARAVATAARRLARRADSDCVQVLALVADRTMAAAQALTRIVRTPEGENLREANDQVRALMRAAGRTRSRSSKAVAKAPATGPTTTPPTNGASVVRPASVAASTSPS